MASARVLFAASEVFPFAKSGGLADVAHSLPRALSAEYGVEVVMPLYRFVERGRFGIRPLGVRFEVSMGGAAYPVELYGCTLEGVRCLFVYSPLLCDRDYLYGPPENGYEDNALRFGIFNYAVVELLRRGSYAVAHLNDWQCALAALLVREEESLQTKTLFTIHNLAYQGTFEKGVLRQLGIAEKHFTMEGIEFYGQVSFMKAGIGYADRITTVSPAYAKEIMTAAFGCGLEGYLQHHRGKLTGILNGIDTAHFSPENDPALPYPCRGLGGKAENKRAFLASVGLRGFRRALFVFIGRFTWQKGLDLLIDTLPEIVAMGGNVAILGEGEAQYRDRLRAVADAHGNVHLAFGYDEALSHRMYAAADFLLMPSLFEPCGLNQMIAMRYGAVPVVHRVGGLADTVHPAAQFDPAVALGYGFAFERPTAKAFAGAVRCAVECYGDRRRFGAMVRHNMRCDFSWDESARHYSVLYRRMAGLS